MPAVQSRRWTAAEVRALPDEPGKRFECVDGELIVSPGPRFPHQRAARDLMIALHPYVSSEGLGDVYQRAGAEYWIVDLDSRVVERWLPGAAAPEVLRDALRWHPAGASAPLVLALTPLFAAAHGER